MTTAIQPLTDITLEDFLQLPETKPASDYIQGVIYQKPMPQTEHSTIQIELGSAINQIGKPPKIAAAFTELRCTFGGSSIVPDIVVFEWENIPRKANGRLDNRVTIAPDWTIEILSPDQSANRVIQKITLCLNHGTKLGWLVDPEDESVLIFGPTQNPELKTGDDALPGLSVLPDWQLTARELFGWLYL
jgi:Uma2 family endonuclease